MFIMPTKIDFIGGNTKRCLMAMALPMIAAMFLNMMYNLVDSLWIGNLLGETAYAALTNSTPIILILTSVAMGATNGVSILLSQAIGAKDKKKTESLISTFFFVAVAFSILVTILLEVFLPGILKVLNTPAETYDMAYSYLAIYILGYLAVYLYLYFTAVLRSFGNSMFQAVAMLVSTILNAILDPIFIHFIGFHGAAIATLLSQAICLLFMLIYLKKKKLFKFKISAFDKNEVLPLIQKAIPSIIQQSIPAISTTFLTALVSTYSVTAIAAYGVTGKLETILFYPAMALNMVLTTIIGQCIGGARYDRAKDYLKCALELSGGQWKRIALYRTLHKKDVDLIVLDEPTANLDPKISENIINRLLKPNYNKTVIVITHDFELAKKFDRIIGMKEGKIICDSPPQAFAWELFEKHNSDKRSFGVVQ